MGLNELTNEKKMTVKEIADVTGISERVLQMNIKKLFPEIVNHGMTTYLNELQITVLKREIEGHHNSESTFGVETKLERKLKIAEGYKLLLDDIAELEKQNIEKQGRIDRLVHDGKTYTTTEIAKELNMKSATALNNILSEKGIQYKLNNTWVLTATYSDMGYESIKQEELDNGKIIYNRHWTGKGRDFILDLFKGGI